MNQNHASALASVFRDGQLRNAAVECTHCHCLLRLSEVPIQILPPATVQLDVGSPSPLTPAPLSAPPSPSCALSPVTERTPQSPASDPNTDSEDSSCKQEELDNTDREDDKDAEKDQSSDAGKWRWSPELKEHFVKAFEILQSRGIHATPKKIMGLMRQNGAPIQSLTMRRVQSHHQKYLKRLKTAGKGKGKSSKNAQAKRAAAAVTRFSLQDSLPETFSTDNYDPEVSRLTSGLEVTRSNSRDDVSGSPMFYTSIAGSPTPGLRSPSPTSPTLNYSMVVNKTTVHPGSPAPFTRGQSSSPIPSAYITPVSPANPKQPTVVATAAAPVKFTPNADIYGTLGSFAVNPNAWQQYMMSGTVVKPSAEKPIAATASSVPAQTYNKLPAMLVHSSSFGTFSAIKDQEAGNPFFAAMPAHDVFGPISPTAASYGNNAAATVFDQSSQSSFADATGLHGFSDFFSDAVVHDVQSEDETFATSDLHDDLMTINSYFTQAASDSQLALAQY